MKLSEMTIKRYYEYLDVLDDSDGFDSLAKKAAFITGRKYIDVLKNMNAIEAIKHATEFDAILNDLSNDLPKENVVVSERVFNVVCEAEKMISGQYIDFFETRKAVQGENRALHKLLAVMAFEGKEYDGTKNAEKEALFLNNMTMGVAYPYAFFLQLRLKVLNEIILPYFAQEMKKEMMWEIKMDSLKGGGGLYYWNVFVLYTTRIWMRFLEYLSLSFLIGGLIFKNLLRKIKSGWKRLKEAILIQVGKKKD